MDIVERLAQWAENDMKAEAVALKAKYEIERLREALTLIAMTKNDDIRPSDEIIKMIWLGCTQIARAALKEGE